MPFVTILRSSRDVTDEDVARLADALVAAVSELISAVDPVHPVDPVEVEVVVHEAGPLDRLRDDVYVSVFARDEPVRRSNAMSVAEGLDRSARVALPSASVLLEFVLTHRSSVYDYAARFR